LSDDRLPSNFVSSKGGMLRRPEVLADNTASCAEVRGVLSSLRPGDERSVARRSRASRRRRRNDHRHDRLLTSTRPIATKWCVKWRRLRGITVTILHA